MASHYGGINGRPMAPVYSPAIASGFYANPANRGKKLSDLWGTMPQFSSWDDAARVDFSGNTHPSFANLNDEGRTNLLRSVYGLSSDYKVQNGQLVQSRPWVARNAWWLAPAAMVGGPALAGAFGGGGAGAAGATAGLGPSTAANIAATSAAAAVPSSLAAGGTAVATGGFWSSPLASMVVGQGVDTVTGLIAAKMQSGAADRAAAQMQQYNQQALDFLKQQDARDHAEYLLERERGWRLQDEDRAQERGRFDAKEGRLTPYRDFGAQGVRNLSSLLTLPQGGVMRDPKLADLLRG